MTQLADLVGEIAAEKPEASPMADEMIKESEAEIAAEIAAEKAEATANATAAPTPAAVPAGDGGEIYIGLVDDKLNPFDPTIHVTPPEKKSDGTWKKKRGRKAGAVNTSAASAEIPAAPVPGEILPAGVTRIEARKAAQQTTGQIFMIGMTLGGEEWAPQIKPEIGLNEPANMVAAWEDYYYQYGIIKPPAWLGLAGVMFAYAAPRFVQPKTQSRFKAAMQWVKSKVKRKAVTEE